MTQDLSALSREALAAMADDLSLEEGGCSDGHALIREIQNRLRADGARIRELEAIVKQYENTAAELRELL